ncbi:hypothetical protein PRZ48_011816 [Zasmidium cellare]|uniref:Calpain catalytic domain-containing protein n=1 Tax=Zasmidium cellare TaxID=395010 RepID=A0ABR0E7Z7_ZASCE|nr:hypothetical protein PRZ48_011816 [Zasmidium cellare]
MGSPLQDLQQLRQHIDHLAERLPQSATKDEALDIAIKSVETALSALKLVKDDNEKASYTARAKQLMQDAETIKRSSDWRQAVQQASQVRVLTEPVNSRELATKERIILLRAGFLNGVKFPEWNGVPAESEFELKDGETLFLDDASELPLSDVQLDVLDDWKRPHEALPPPSWPREQRDSAGPSMQVCKDTDLVQDAATDCSVVASLCAGVARSQRGHPRMMQAILYPYNLATSRPLLSDNGKYIVRMNFNGCYRKVVIDDRIPTSSTSRVIHVVDRNNPSLLWPALLEKAYLKVRGGYDFPGSNSATDLWILTGWIPEQVFLQEDDLELDRFWKRISSAFSYGDVLITMGTGKMSSKTERALGLAGEHDYAVLDLREVDGQRLLLIKNPWVEGTSWRGRFKGAAGSGNATDLIQLEDDSEPVQSPRDLLNVNEELKPGTFWMDLDNVLQNFESMYLNWNSGLFRHRQDVHFGWDLSESTNNSGIKKMRGPSFSLQHNPQFTVTTTKKSDVWILLWRHFQNSVPENATSDEIESGRHHIDLSGHIALIAFASGGRKVLLSEKYLQKTWFVDSPQTLIKLEDCEPNTPYTIVPLEQELPATNHTFTISTFSNAPMKVGEASPRYSHTFPITGAWTKETAGGNAQHVSYCDNPQYSLLVPQKTSICMLLEGYNEKLNVHVKLLHSNGQRVFRIRNRDIIVDSKEYRPGCCLAEFEDLEAGRYTIICSTFEPQQLDNFALQIMSASPIGATLLPREGAGRIRTELSTVVFKQGESKVAAPLAPQRLVNLYAIARHLDQQPAGNTSARRSNHSHIRLSIELGRGPQRRILIASNNGEYSDSGGPVRTDAFDLGPDFAKYGYRDCWIVLDRMYVSSEAQEEQFVVEVFVDQPNSLDCGDWRAWDD